MRMRAMFYVSRICHQMPLVVPLAFLVCNLVLVIIPLILKPMSCVSGLAISFGTGTLYYILVIVKPFELRSMTKLSGT